MELCEGKTNKTFYGQFSLLLRLLHRFAFHRCLILFTISIKTSLLLVLPQHFCRLAVQICRASKGNCEDPLRSGGSIDAVCMLSFICDMADCFRRHRFHKHRKWALARISLPPPLLGNVRNEALSFHFNSPLTPWLIFDKRLVSCPRCHEIWSRCDDKSCIPVCERYNVSGKECEEGAKAILIFCWGSTQPQATFSSRSSRSFACLLMYPHPNQQHHRIFSQAILSQGLSLNFR
jgi:hypothetical protein